MRKRGSLHIGAILLGGLVASVFFAAGCGEQGKKQVTIAVIPKGTAHEFWQTVHAGALQASKDLDVKIEWQGPQTEIQRDLQIEIVENFIAKMVDAIALAPQDADALLPVIKRVNQDKIPLVLFDSDANTEDYVSFVATDNYEGGVKAAQALAELLGNKGKVIVIANEPGSGSTDKREQGFKDAIAKNFPEIEIVDMQYGNSDRARARAVTEDLLTRNPDVDGIFASCEPMTFGAWQALRAQDLAGKKKLVGFDASEKLNEALRAGEINALVLQDPFRMGYLAVSTLVDAMNGKTPDKRIDTGVKVIKTETMDEPENAKLLQPDLSSLDE